MDRNGRDPARIAYLDAWRFLAVALVIGSHYVGSQVLTGPDASAALRQTVNLTGRFGVLLFFCISGFVICRGLRIEREERGRISLLAFYVRRFVRIVPPLVFYVAGLWWFARVGVIQLGEADTRNVLAFMCNLPLTSECTWWTAHTWSLAYEEQFYLAFPLAVIVCGFVRHPGRMVAVLIGGMLASVVLFLLPLHHFYADYLGTVGYLLIGCVAALYWERPEGAWLRTHVSGGVWATAAIVAMVSAIGTWSGFTLQWMSAVVGPLAVCLMVFFVPMDAPLIGALFRNPLIRHIGRASYSIYLWQQLAVRLVGENRPLATLAVMVATIAACLVAFAYVERPLMRFGARWSDRLKSQRTVVGGLQEPA